jgi:periplasmic copper chaperone A
MKQQIAALITGTAICLAPLTAGAHIGASAPTGAAIANATQEISFAVGHGCEGSDTYSVRVQIPAGVTSVRPIEGDFGKVTLIERDAAQNIVAVTWTKTDPVLPADTNFYKLVLRLKVPNQPFTTVYFPTRQVCRTADGTTLPPVDWAATEPSTDGGMDEPAPSLKIVPARRSGWNKITLSAAVTNLGAYFDDAEIVWKGSQAFSANPATVELISGTAGVTPLTSLAAGDVIWVKY